MEVGLTKNLMIIEDIVRLVNKKNVDKLETFTKFNR